MSTEPIDSAHADSAPTDDEHDKPIGTILIVTLFLIAQIGVWGFTYYLVVHRS